MSYSLGIAPLEARRRAVEQADPAVRSIAQDLVDQGNTAFRAADYDTAIRRYTDAWTVYPAQNVLLLIGVVMMRQGRFRDASYRFQRYLRECPGCDQTELAQTQLANAQAALERGGQPVDMDFVAEGYTPPAPSSGQVSRQAVEQARQTITTPQQAQQQAPPPTSIRNPYEEQTYGVWIATGVGVVGLIVMGVWLSRRRKRRVAANRRRRRRRTSRRR